MKEKEEYVKLINTIFEVLEKLKEAYPDNDNKANIEAIEEYRPDLQYSVDNYSDNKKVEALGEW